MNLLQSKIRLWAILPLAIVFMQCEKQELIDDELSFKIEESNMQKAIALDEESAGNNLSFPVIWSDGYALNLREAPTPGEVMTNGDWWYVWGVDPIDPQADIFSCYPSEVKEFLCIDQTEPGDGGEVYKAYVQKDPLNVWQADNFMVNGPVNVDLIDWGDNLESIDWGIKSQVRTEVVLYKNLKETVTEYAMRHASGWGVDEIHGLQTDLNDEIVYGPGNQATIYSHNARLTIQKLNVNREDIEESDLYWIPSKGWSETNRSDDIINDPIFNKEVYNAGDGPGFYQAEVNVKGKIIYGYTWNVRQLNDGVGDYRITFSLDNQGAVPLNTFFNEWTEILLPDELERALAEGEEIRGGVAEIDLANNLSYMDIRILPKTTGNGGGNSGGGNGNGGGNSGGGHGN
ncbi:hypothetical protein SAMN04515667_1623 [Formosa sp. Hel1_31_208]|uniref:hypothetical protein n=1 Tax=Formosa sp. Hel1_31_208 TaxID=1798225 RepID=UPI00087BC57E|nr:hypothetical protein [Formosa sp. Hel1_31_208]SDS19485.1 hypothetical protein SAMN04515667_1623 [Formosa sp. Hel1_31_208]